MTRTARATYPRAVLRDRSISRTGYDKSLNKGGAGAHGWGSMGDEYMLETAGALDAALENDYHDNDEERDQVHFDTRTGTIVGPLTASSPTVSESEGGPLHHERRRRSNSTLSSGSNGVTESDRAHARTFRTGSFSGNRTDIDLASIARTSSAVSSSPTSTNFANRRV